MQLVSYHIYLKPLKKYTYNFIKPFLLEKMFHNLNISKTGFFFKPNCRKYFSIEIGIDLTCPPYY